MTGKHWIFAAAVTISFGTLLFAADEASPPATQPAAESATAHHRSKLAQPYGEMRSLTDEQKAKIEKIHAETLEQRKALEEKEKSDIAALLSDDQKAELSKIEDEVATQHKERSSNRRKQKMDESSAEPTTMPAQ